MKIKTKKKLMLLSLSISLLTLFGSCQKDDITTLDTSAGQEKDSVSHTDKDSLNTRPEVSEGKIPADTLKDTIIDSNVNAAEPLPQPVPEESRSPVSPNAYHIELALPTGYVKDGTVDYTNQIQAALNNYTELVFPEFPIMINDSGLKIPSNRTIHFAPGSEIKLKPSSKSNYDIIRIDNASNITLNNPHIIGDRYNHLGSSGEWGHGIGIYSSKNITINEAKVYNCWGDGIYIGTWNDMPNENIKLIKPYCKSNRRDGISIISVIGLEIEKPYAGYSDGVAPFCGINIEPNTERDELKNIVIKGAFTEHNKGNGIQAGLGRMYGGKDKEVNIFIENHKDIGSETALLTTCYTKMKKGSEKISGLFSIIGADWQKNIKQPLNVYYPENYLKFKLSKPKVMDKSGSYLTDEAAKTVLEQGRSIWKPTDYTLTF